MQILKVAEPTALSEFVEGLKAGKLVIFPTDTVYGLGCTLSAPETIKKIFELKGRKPDKPFPLLVADLKTALRMAHFSESAKKMAEKFWPGPVTLILKSRRPLPKACRGRPLSPLVSKKGTVGLRIPDHPFLRMALKKIRRPIIGTSANLTGEKPAGEISGISESLKLNVDLVIDGGKTSGKPSTIYDCTGPKPVVIRP